MRVKIGERDGCENLAVVGIEHDARRPDCLVLFYCGCELVAQDVLDANIHTEIQGRLGAAIPGGGAQPFVEALLNSRETSVVDTRVADNVSDQAALRINALLLL